MEATFFVFHRDDFIVLVHVTSDLVVNIRLFAAGVDYADKRNQPLDLFRLVKELVPDL